MFTLPASIFSKAALDCISRAWEQEVFPEVWPPKVLAVDEVENEIKNEEMMSVPEEFEFVHTNNLERGAENYMSQNDEHDSREENLVAKISVNQLNIQNNV